MSKYKQGSGHHHPHGSEEETHTKAVPYWRRAHTDWRFQVVVAVMLIAITIYVMSDNLSLGPQISPAGTMQ